MSEIKIIFYKNTSPPNTVNKKLVKVSDDPDDDVIDEIRFFEKDAFDLLHPSLLIRFKTGGIGSISKYNYMYIENLHRYYYIDSIKSEGGLWRIDGRCDVLMSHKKDILASKQYIIRQEKSNNSPYLEDSLLPISSKHSTKGRKLTGRKVADVTCGRVILATTGRGGTPI